MRRFFFAVVLLAATGALGPRTQADSGTETQPYDLADTIVVTANRVGTSLRETSNSITVITEADIAAGQATTVSELLRSVPGVDVVQSGGPGRATSVFLRGANSHHTLVLIDGIEMSDPSSSNGAYDFAHLNTENIERIEILRGAQSVLYGSDAIGGVIHIMTKRGFGKTRVEAQSEAGSYGLWNESLSVGGGTNRTDFVITLSRKDWDGFSATRGDRAEVEPDGYENTELAGRIGLRLPNEMALSLSGQVSNALADIDKSWGVLDDPNATNATDSRRMAINLRSRSSDAVWRPSVEVQWLSQELESLDAVDADHPQASSRYSSEGTRLRFGTQQEFHLGNHTLLAGAETEKEEYQSSSYSEGAWGPYGDTVAPVDTRTTSLYLLERFAVKDRWYGSVGVRRDHHEAFGNEVTYRLSSAYLLDGPGVKIRGALSSGFKSPSLFQLYHETYGNADLEPEESIGWELGIDKTFSSQRVSMGLTYYRAEMENLVALDPSTFRSLNIGEASSRGVELYGEYRTDKTVLRVDYTYADTRNESDTVPIIRRPKHKLNASISQSLSDRTTLNLDLIHVGKRYDTDFRPFPAELVTLDKHTITNLSVSYQILEWMQLRGRVHNLFNADYEEVLTYSVSRRAAFVGMKVEL